MTNPQGAPDQDPSVWARPGTPSSAAQPVAPTQPYRPPTAPDYSAAPRYGQLPWQDVAARMKTNRRFTYDPLSVILTLVIVVTLLGSGLIVAEIYARQRANNVVAAAAECEVKDKVQASIGIGASPFLLQHLIGRYTGISIHTAGNQIRGGKGMKADITVNNLTLHSNANSEGTIGAVDATITWTSDGIRETVQDAVPLGDLLFKTVKASPDTGTIELSGRLGMGSITLKPRIAGNGVGLEIVNLTARHSAVRHETAQQALDEVTANLTNDYPLGVRADSVQVTNDGVVTHFSARNAVIPREVDPCFAHI